MSGNSLHVRGPRVTEAVPKNPSSAARAPGELWASLQPLRRMADEERGERGEPFVSLTTKVQIAAHYVSQMVWTAVFWNGGPQGKGRTRHWNSIGVTCVIGALIFKMVIYCCCSSKDNSVEDHHWDVKLFPFLGRSHYFINHYFSFQKFPLCLGLTGGLKNRLLHKSLFSESLQISCKIACVVGSYFFALQYCF